MRQTLRWFGFALAALPMLVVAAGIEEGRHYTEILFPQPVETENQIEVREFFWYGCPHCYTLEPAIDRWLAKKPKNVGFVRTPGTSPNWLLHAQAYYAAESLGVLPKLHAALFRAMHEQKRRLNDEASLLEFVKEQGVDTGKFKAAMDSFGVRLKVEKAKRLNEAYTVHSVPTIVVDGKYLTSPSMAGGDAAIMQVVDQLVKKAAAQRKR